LGFFGGGVRFSSVFPTVFFRFLRIQIFPFEDFNSSHKIWRENERPRISQKNENTIFSSGNQIAKSGYFPTQVSQIVKVILVHRILLAFAARFLRGTCRLLCSLQFFLVVSA
jgi:hypothetical protein